MAKKESAEKILKKLADTSKAVEIPRTSIIVDRRKALPQPDFTHYRQAGSYPGAAYFFVGHSYNVEHRCCSGQFSMKRKAAIKQVLKEASKTHSVLVKDALQHSEFVEVLSRVERDWLGRLPEGALIGPAIDEDGAEIAQSFTVWRKEQRKTAPAPKENVKAADTKTSSKSQAKSPVKANAKKEKATVSSRR